MGLRGPRPRRLRPPSPLPGGLPLPPLSPGDGATWPGSLRAGGAGGEGVGDEAHLVVGEGPRRVAVLFVAQHIWEVLLYGAPVGDVEDLHPAADAQDGQPAL